MPTPPDQTTPRANGPRLIPAVVGLCVALLVMSAWSLIDNLLQKQQLDLARNEADQQLERLTGRIKHGLETHLQVVAGLAETVAASGGRLSDDDFQQMAGFLYPVADGTLGLQLAPDGVIRQVYPLDKHRNVIGLDLLSTPLQRSRAKQAIRDRSPWLEGPIDLLQGGRALIARWPVMVDGKFWGFATMLIDLPRLLAGAGYEPEQHPLRIDIRQQDKGGQYLPVQGDPSVEQQDPIRRDLPLPGQHWQISAVPRDGWPDSWRGADWLAINSLIIAIALGSLVFLLLQRRGQLELELTQRARTETMERGRRQALEALATGLPLNEVFERLLRNLNLVARDAACFVMICEGPDAPPTVLAAPNLPDDAGDWLEPPADQPNPICEVMHGEHDGLVIEHDLAERKHWQYLHRDRYQTLVAHAVRDREEALLGCFVVLTPEAQPARSDDCRAYVAELSELGALAIRQRRAEARLREAATVFDNAAEGVIICNREGQILSVNRSFVQLTGYPAEQVSGRSPQLLVSDRHPARLFEELWQQVIESGQWQGEIWMRRDNGSLIPTWNNVSVVRDGDGRISQFVLIFSDITPMKQSEQRLQHIAHHDTLTGLPNRLLLVDRLEQAIERARRQQSRIAVLFLDLDGFKHVNDSLGHPVGDRLLKQVASRLGERVRAEDTVARLGGDEFVIMLERIGDDSGHTEQVAGKVLDAFCRPFEIGDSSLYVGTSIGIALYPDDGTSADALIRNADAAMYSAKSAGRGCYHYYTHWLTEQAEARVQMETELRQALEQNQLRLYYQPQVNLSDGHICGVEALVRWQHPRHGLIGSGEFLPLARETGLIQPISDWVLQQACAEAALWLEQGLFSGQIAVNLAGLPLQSERIVGSVRAALSSSNLPPRHLQLELTEELMMGHEPSTLKVLARLREIGVSLAVDDFGSGYSSLAFIKRLPLDRLKIDRSFTAKLLNDGNDAAIVRTIIALGHTLGLQLVAEGVEDMAQSEWLLDEGVEVGQGFLFGSPMDSTQLRSRLGEAHGVEQAG